MHNFRLLKKLAEIVVDIGENKTLVDYVKYLTAYCTFILEKTKLTKLDTDELHQIFIEIHEVKFTKNRLAFLIHTAHNEIERLMGDEAWRVYRENSLRFL